MTSSSKALRNAAARALLTLTTFLALGLVAEIAVRTLCANRLIYDMEMYRYARLLKRRSAAPGLEFEHVPGARARLMGVDVRINSLGLRGPELEARVPARTKTILLVGDSISFGWGVPEERTFAARVERGLDEETRRRGGSAVFRVLDAGVGNFNAAMKRAQLRRLEAAVRPDVVVLQYFVDDPTERAFSRDDALVRRSYAAAYVAARLKQALLLRGGGLEAYYDRLYAPDSPGWLRTRQALRSVRDDCAAAGRPLVVLAVPDLHDLSPGGRLRRAHDAAVAFMRSEGLAVVDPADDLAAACPGRSCWVAPDDAHPNEKGHEVLARALLPALAEASAPLLRASAAKRHNRAHR